MRSRIPLAERVQEKKLMKIIPQGIDFMTDILFPRRCPVCGGIVLPKGDLICPGCMTKLSWVRRPVCKKCGKEVLDETIEYCYDCTRHKRSFDYGLSLINYDETASHSMARIKYNIGAAYRRPEVLTMEVRGRNLVTGLPKTIVVTSDETLEALREPALQIVDAVHNVLERTPPELAADIFDRGIVMTGGGSLLSGLDALIEEKTGITTMIAEDPLTAVAIGTGKFIEFAHGMNMAMEASMGVGGGREDY